MNQRLKTPVRVFIVPACVHDFVSLNVRIIFHSNYPSPASPGNCAQSIRTGWLPLRPPLRTGSTDGYWPDISGQIDPQEIDCNWPIIIPWWQNFDQWNARLVPRCVHILATLSFNFIDEKHANCFSSSDYSESQKWFSPSVTQIAFIKLKDR